MHSYLQLYYLTRATSCSAQNFSLAKINDQERRNNSFPVTLTSKSLQSVFMEDYHKSARQHVTC